LESQLQFGVSLSTPPPDLSLFTDASLHGWGTHLENGDRTTQGTWTREEFILPINVLEMKAVLLAVRAFSPLLSGKRVSLLSDNSTVVAYIRKHGDQVRHPVSSDLRITAPLQQGDLCLGSASHSGQTKHSGRCSVLHNQGCADGMEPPSGGGRQALPDPIIDLFRDQADQTSPSLLLSSARLQCSRSRQPVSPVGRAERVCVSSPAAGSTRLEQVVSSKVNLFLIAPCWPYQAWFPALLELLMDHPRRIPPWTHLLWHPIAGIFHANPDFYRLHAWKLSGFSFEREVFLRTLSIGCPNLRGVLPLPPFREIGPYSSLGAETLVHLQSLSLFPNC